MKGFAMLGERKTGIIEKPNPTIRYPTDAIIKVTAVAPCTTEIHALENAAIPGMIGNFIGHEAVGVIDSVGSDVKDFKPGDRVVISDVSPDWNSLEAQDQIPGRSKGCVRTSNPDMQGMFAEYVLYERADANLARIPDNVTDQQALMVVDMIATAAAPMDFLNIQLGETVAVLGIGPVGLMGVELSVLHGAGRVFAVGSRQACFDAALKLGATDCINYRKGSISKQILEQNGKPVDKVLICGGTADILSEALTICKTGGKIANVAIFYDVCNDNAQILDFKHFAKDFKGFSLKSGRLFLERALAAIQYGRLHPEYIISHVMYGFESIPEAFELMSNKDPKMIKPVVIL